MRKYVYEVISTNICTGGKDCDYFDSAKAAYKFKELKESDGYFSAEVRQWRMCNIKDI